MMDLDLSNVRLFEAAGKDPYLGRLVAHYPRHPEESIPAIPKEFFISAVGECRNRMEKVLGECETSYRNTSAGRSFDERVSSPAAFPEYSIHTRKNDTSIADVKKYALRDGTQYITLWVGVRNDPLWLAIAKLVGFMTSLDDLAVRPSDIAAGIYKVGEESLEDLLSRIRSLGRSRDVRWLDACHKDVTFASRIQFAEKWAACPHEDALAPEEVNIIRFYTAELAKNTLQASILRSFDTMAFGCLCLLSYYYDFGYEDTDWSCFHASALCDGLGMDIGKDSVGIGIKDPTSFGDLPRETLATNAWRREKIGELFYQLTRYFSNAIDSPASVYDRFARVALSYARLGDRYLERQTMSRFALTEDMVRLVDELQGRSL